MITIFDAARCFNSGSFAQQTSIFQAIVCCWVVDFRLGWKTRCVSPALYSWLVVYFEYSNRTNRLCSKKIVLIVMCVTVFSLANFVVGKWIFNSVGDELFGLAVFTQRETQSGDVLWFIHETVISRCSLPSRRTHANVIGMISLECNPSFHPTGNVTNTWINNTLFIDYFQVGSGPPYFFLPPSCGGRGSI